MKKKYDSETARKIINDYAEKLNKYICENNSLTNQLYDMKINLDINKKIMLSTLNGDKNETLTNEIRTEVERLSISNNELHQQKLQTEKKVSFIIKKF